MALIGDAVTRAIFSSMDVGANAVSLVTDEHQTASRRTYRIGRIALDALSVASSGTIATGASLEVQSGLAVTEFMANLFVSPVTWVALLADLGEKGTPVTWGDIARITETVSADILRIIRAAATGITIEEKRWLAKLEKEGEGATRSVYESDGESQRYVGERPIDKAESEGAIEAASGVSHTSHVLELLVRNHVPSAVLGSVAFMVAAFAQFIRDQLAEIGGHENLRPLRDRETIPEYYIEDPVLSQYLCPITLLPMRHPVTDPTTNTMYERFAIERWIDERGTSPLSNNPLRKEDLVPAEAAQGAIDARLEVLQGEYDLRAERIRRRLARIEPELIDGEHAELERVLGVNPAEPPVQVVAAPQPVQIGAPPQPVQVVAAPQPVQVVAAPHNEQPVVRLRAFDHQRL